MKDTQDSQGHGSEAEFGAPSFSQIEAMEELIRSQSKSPERPVSPFT